MKCPNCNKEVTDDTKFCPECGHNFSQPQQETPVQQQEQSKPEKKKKKPLWLKIVIGVVCLFILFSMLGSCSDSSDSSKSSKVKTTSTSSEIEETTVVVDSDTSSNSSQGSSASSHDETKSNSENSNKSTPINIYTNLSKYATVGWEWEGFKVSPKAKKFISEHPDLFPAISEEAVCYDYVDYSIEFKHLSRDIEEYGDRMVTVTGDITDIKPIKPEKTGLDDIITEIKMSVYDPDKGFVRDTYYVYYIGSLDLYIGDEIAMYGVPIDIQYEQPILAASYVEIVEAG